MNPIPTGLPDLDARIGGLQRGELTIVSSKPAHGKSALLCSIVAHVGLELRLPVVFFSLDMGPDAVVERLLGPHVRAQVTKSAGSIDALADTPITIEADVGCWTAEGIEARVGELNRSHPIALVAIDYLQLMTGGSPRDSSDTAFRECARQLRALAQQLNIAVVIANQIFLSARPKKPAFCMADFGCGKGLKRHADLLLLVYRELRQAPDGEVQTDAEVVITAQGKGSLGAVRLQLNPVTRCFESFSRALPITVLADHKASNAAAVPDRPVALDITVGVGDKGEPVVVNLMRQGHMLVAGNVSATWLSVVTAAMLTKLTPQAVRLLVIDVPGGSLAGLHRSPHLLVPVLHEAAPIQIALAWARTEMLRRHALLTSSNVRNITAYRVRRDELQSAAAVASDLVGCGDRCVPPPMAHIVIVIAEFADLMASGDRDVAVTVASIAQKGRAFGIHVVLRTACPTAGVITKIMRANFPTRVLGKGATPKQSKAALGLDASHHFDTGCDLVLVSGADSHDAQRCWGSAGVASPALPDTRRPAPFHSELMALLDLY